MLSFRRTFGKIVNQKRTICTNDSLIQNINEVVNKNPRNLELLRIARKPKGYYLDDRKQEFWHKLEIKKFSRYIIAEIQHFENGTVISVSSKENGLMKQLYSLTDCSAYINVGHTLGKRCLESGIYEVRCDLNSTNSEKINLLLKAVTEAGLKLSESSVYRHALPQSSYRHEKPWEVFE